MLRSSFQAHSFCASPQCLPGSHFSHSQPQGGAGTRGLSLSMLVVVIQMPPAVESVFLEAMTAAGSFITNYTEARYTRHNVRVETSIRLWSEWRLEKAGREIGAVGLPNA